jgi:hypothetical protein
LSIKFLPTHTFNTTFNRSYISSYNYSQRIHSIQPLHQILFLIQFLPTHTFSTTVNLTYISPYNYSQRIHSIQPLTTVPFLNTIITNAHIQYNRLHQFLFLIQFLPMHTFSTTVNLSYISSYNYSQRIHSVKPLTPVPFLNSIITNAHIQYNRLYQFLLLIQFLPTHTFSTTFHLSYISSYNYSQRIHSVQPLPPVPFLNTIITNANIQYKRLHQFLFLNTIINHDTFRKTVYPRSFS